MMKTKRLVYMGLLTAIAFVMTRFLQIPLFGGFGYAHLGDSMIYFTAFTMGSIPAAVVGGIGGALADLTSPFAVYTLPTLLIKAAVGFLAGFIYFKFKNKKFSMAAAFTIGGLLMIAGYYVAETVIYGNIAAPLVSVPMNLVQAAFSVPVPLILMKALKGKIK